MNVTENTQPHGTKALSSAESVNKTNEGGQVGVSEGGTETAGGGTLSLFMIGNEPSMYLQRPSSASCQDVAHVLARTFRERFTRLTITAETVHQLMTSQYGGDDAYHQRYVGALLRVSWNCLNIYRTKLRYWQ